MKLRLFSGMQPTGELHLGNYLGALKNWVKLSMIHEGIFCIVDYHAMTMPYDPTKLKERIEHVALGYLASGIDPESSVIFVQSYVPEHTELAWIFNTLTPIGMLERMTQFKDKSTRGQSINIALLDYPVLQAADILLYKATGVPVGEDQMQHLELTREIARKFNNSFGQTFEEPQTVLSPAPRVMGLDGQNKMSKSLDNHIAIFDPPDVVWEKISKRGVTDIKRVRRSDPGEPNDCNIYSWHTFFSTPEEQNEVAKGCRSAGIGCGDCKKMLSNNISSELAPIQAKKQEIESNKTYVHEVLEAGARKAKMIAEATMTEVRNKTGIR